MLKSLFALFMLVFISGCSTLKVSSDFDKEFDLSKLSTYIILQPKTQYNSLTTKRINKAIESVLTQKGYKLVTHKDKASFYLLYHVNVTNKTQMNTDYQFVGIRPYGYGATMVATTRTYNYDEGKLIIDIIDPKKESVIFEAVLKDELPNLTTPKEREAYIFKAVRAALEKFPSKH